LGTRDRISSIRQRRKSDCGCASEEHWYEVQMSGLLVGRVTVSVIDVTRLAVKQKS